MCAKLPQNEMDFLSISGVGKSKLEKYGERFLGVVRDYLQHHEAPLAAPVQEMESAESVQEFLQKNLEFSKEPVMISALIQQLNALLVMRNQPQIKVLHVTNQLLADGYLESVEQDGKKHRVASEKGKAMGITSERRTSANGEVYWANLYDERAQRWVAEGVLNL
jgi:ATP-dependent DNA helicase RecQ